MKMITWMIIAGILICVGLILFGTVMTVFSWDFTRLSTVQAVTNTHQISKRVISVDLQSATADVEFLPSEDDKCTVVCQEFEKQTHTVEVENGVLRIRYVDDRRWYEHIEISTGGSKVTVYLPEGEYEQVTAKITTGDIRMEKLRAFRIDLGVTTGDIQMFRVDCMGAVTLDVRTGKTALTEVFCESLEASGTTGDISLKHVFASEDIRIQRNTGSVYFDACDAQELNVTTTTGDVEGSLITSKTFITKTNTGSVQVPEGMSDEKCRITTTTGDIKFTISD